MKIIIFFAGLLSILPGIAWSAERVVVVPLNSRSSTPSQSWDTILPDANRFTLIMSDAAVLDNETGLVWERTPVTSTATWTSARSGCYNRVIVNRLGWRLPTIEELSSLVDKSNSSPSLPVNHPFDIIQSGRYWSTTSVDWIANYAWTVRFSNGTPNQDDKTDSYYYWCVRGGQGPDIDN